MNVSGRGNSGRGDLARGPGKVGLGKIGQGAARGNIGRGKYRPREHRPRRYRPRRIRREIPVAGNIGWEPAAGEMPGVEPGAGTYYLMPAGAIRVKRGQPGKLGPTEAILAIQGNSSPG